MKLIPLHGKYGNGKDVMIDDDLFEWLNQWRWFYPPSGNRMFHYVSRNILKPKNKTIIMHRLIMNTPTGMDTDHKNHNTLNNQRYNLRVCTRFQNMWNRLPEKGGTSKYKGVCWHKGHKKWVAQIILKNKHLHLGDFIDEVEAAKTYDCKAVELHGEFARINFPT